MAEKTTHPQIRREPSALSDQTFHFLCSHGMFWIPGAWGRGPGEDARRKIGSANKALCGYPVGVLCCKTATPVE